MSYADCNGFNPPKMRNIEINHNWKLDSYDWPLLRAPSGLIYMTDTIDKWEVGLNAEDFRPSEIRISIQPHDSGHDLIINGSHAYRKDEIGSIARKIHRICHIPADVDTNTIVSNLYPNGVLTIKAKKKSGNKNV